MKPLLFASIAAALAQTPEVPSTRFVDLDGDGLLDRLRIAGGHATLAWNDSDRGFATAIPLGAGCPVRNLVVADLDDDGGLDLYVLRDGPNVALVADGMRGFADRTFELGLTAEGHSIGAQRLDLDADGRQDLLVHNQGGDVVFWGVDGGGFRAEPIDVAGEVALPAPLPRAATSFAQSSDADGARGGSAPHGGVHVRRMRDASSGSAGLSVLNRAETRTAAPQHLSPLALPPSLDALQLGHGPGGGVPSGTLVLWSGSNPPAGFSATPWTLDLKPEPSWSPGTSMLIPVHGTPSAVVGGKLYSFGGISTSGGGFLRTVQEYDPGTNAWTFKTPMPEGQINGCTAVTGGKAYVCSGRYTSGVAHPTVREYDPVLDTWRTVSPMPVAIYAAAAASVGGKIYVLGGWNGSSNQDAIYEYDPMLDTWTTLPATLPQPMRSITAVALDDKIYVLGGYGPPYSSTVHVFDPANGTFSTTAPVPAGFWTGGAAVLEGKIHVVLGALNSTVYTNEAYAYNPAGDFWERLPDLQQAHSSGAVHALNGRLHVFGGYESGSSTAAHEVLDPGGPLLSVIQKD